MDPKFSEIRSRIRARHRDPQPCLEPGVDVDAPVIILHRQVQDAAYNEQGQTVHRTAIMHYIDIHL